MVDDLSDQKTAPRRSDALSGASVDLSRALKVASLNAPVTRGDMIEVAAVLRLTAERLGTRRLRVTDDAAMVAAEMMAEAIESTFHDPEDD